MAQNKIAIPTPLLAEAAEWLMEMQDQDFSTVQQQQFEQWKNQSPLHQAAWQQAAQFQHDIQDMPENMRNEVFEDRQQQSFQSKFLSLAILLGGSALLAYFAHQQAWFADYRTDYGVQQTIQLADGTRLILNSKTAIDLDYNAQSRNITLRYGEIFIQTAKDVQSPARPLQVFTEQGKVRSLGTQFTVSQLKDLSQVAVQQHAVLITTRYGQQLQLSEGQQGLFNQQQIFQPQPIDQLNFAWQKHLIVADRLRLSEFAKQIEKQYGYSVDVPENLHSLIISGTYPANDVQGLISSLSQAYDLNIEKNILHTHLKITKK